MLMTMQLRTLALTSLIGAASVAAAPSPAHAQSPVPGNTPPVEQTMAPDYADDTRGVFVPHHKQLRMKTRRELNQEHNQYQLAQATGGNSDSFEDEMRRLAGEENNGFDREMDRIAGQNGQQGGQQGMAPRQSSRSQMNRSQANRSQPGRSGGFSQQQNTTRDGGVELARSAPSARSTVDMNNALVRVREERITVRRVVQRMMDQIGASDWTIVWDLSQQNQPLAEMEISIDANEPFINVLNALLARLQTRSGEPLRVIKYDNTRRMVITDRRSGHRMSGDSVSPIGVETDGEVMVTEQMLKEAMISLHYDEIPLVDALESIVNQAGKGQWRLRIYAGVDQVLKPAHVEEPFSIAMERLLRLFNLKYEIFPGGKLVVVTKTNRFGFSAATD